MFNFHIVKLKDEKNSLKKIEDSTEDFEDQNWVQEQTLGYKNKKTYSLKLL